MQVPDLILMTEYGDLDVEATPVVVLSCGHLFTAETLDSHLGIGDVFEIDAAGAHQCCTEGWD